VVHHEEDERSRGPTTPLMGISDTAPIAAIATAPGRGGIGVIRISGKSLAGLSDALLGRLLTPRHAHFLPFLDELGNPIDHGIALFFPSPNSYTGEDVLELHGHGGTAVLQRLLERCLLVGQSLGLRLAQPGEFSLRAYLNGKMDLTQAEAVSDLINASSEAAAKAAMASLSGRFSDEINKLITDVVTLRTLVEATLDFPEEEIEFIEKYQVRHKLDALCCALQDVIATTKQSSFLQEGLKVVLAGEPNVGKSSLLNAIFGQELAIVTDIAGTTRDRIRETLHIEGVPIQVTDTAGLRDTQDLIERIGIERSWEAIENCDLILDVMDASQPRSAISTELCRPGLQNKPKEAIFNKIDLLSSDALAELKRGCSGVFVSAKTGSGLDELKQRILAIAGRQPGEISPWLGRTRHVIALEAANDHLAIACEHASHDDRVLDLLAEELRLAHASLGEITGQMTADELLGKIFSSFCIGK
jgi:tRNA modification GTPase